MDLFLSFTAHGYPPLNFLKTDWLASMFTLKEHFAFVHNFSSQPEFYIYSPLHISIIVLKYKHLCLIDSHNCLCLFSKEMNDNK